MLHVHRLLERRCRSRERARVTLDPATPGNPPIIRGGESFHRRRKSPNIPLFLMDLRPSNARAREMRTSVSNEARNRMRRYLSFNEAFPTEIQRLSGS